MFFFLIINKSLHPYFFRERRGLWLRQRLPQLILHPFSAEGKFLFQSIRSRRQRGVDRPLNIEIALILLDSNDVSF